MTVREIALPPDAAAEQVAETLRVHGIAQLVGALDAPLLAALRHEFERAFEASDPGIDLRHEHPTNRGGRVVRTTTRRLDPAHFRASRSVWLSERHERIARAYYAPHEVRVNEQLFFTHERACEREILPWHFDRQQSLKFWVYLTDCPREAGAFEYALGSHREGRFRASYYLLKGVPLRELPNDVPADEVRGAACIEGAAGDLVIFDSDGFHKGGTVGPGRERRVMRGHSHPVAARGPLAAGVAQRALVRLHRLWSPLSARIERVVGDRARTRAEKTRPDAYRELPPVAGEH